MTKFWKFMNSFYEKVMLGVFVLAFLVVIYAAYDTWYVFDHANDDSYLRFKPDVVNAATLDESPISSDMVAWLTIDNTNIDYPVMQGVNNSQYLNLDAYGEFSLSGSIFLDSRNSSDFSDAYSIVYGHHMEYGSMFGALDEFLDQDYLNSHTHGTLIVGREAGRSYDLEIFCAMSADAKDETVFDTDKAEELITLLREMGFDRDNRIVCLSTCAGGASTERTVVFAYILEN
ncbi:sortase B [Ruminococcaceae bacterium YRB3002]|nr:sortase B [Ruminococcaceae bacterium YRB3002]